MIGILSVGLNIAQANISCGKDKKACDLVWFEEPEITNPMQCGDTQGPLTYLVKYNTPNPIAFTSTIITLSGDTSPDSTLTVTQGACNTSNKTCPIYVSINAAPSTSLDPFPQEISRQLVVTPDTLQSEPLRSNIEVEIDCGANSKCATVGFYNDPSQILPLSYTSNNSGVDWLVSTALPLPTGRNYQLREISCLSSGKCSAVGYYVDTDSIQVPLSYTSNNWGMDWLVSTTLPPQQGGVFNVLNSNSCTSTGKCAAVGNYTQGTQNVPLSYTSSNFGVTWVLSSSLPAVQGSVDVLESVSCLSGGQCVAVGFYLNGSAQQVPSTYKSSNFGDTWAISSTPPPTQGIYSNTLYSVSCVSSGKCAAVGVYYNGSNNVPLFYNSSDFGDSWALSTTPTPVLGQNYNLQGISCVNGGQCSAVGFYKNGSQNIPISYTSINFGVNWVLSTSPPPVVGNFDNLLESVSCTSNGQCSTVGYYSNGTNFTPLSYTSSNFGDTWALSTTLPPPQDVRPNALFSISCVE
jgi:hypothetical protein